MNNNNKHKAILVMIISIGIVIGGIYCYMKGSFNEDLQMPIFGLVIFALIMTVYANAIKKKNKYIDTRKRKELLKELFPEYCKEQEISKEEVKRIGLNEPWKNFWNEGMLEIKDEESNTQIYKYFTTKVGDNNKEEMYENGIMVKFCNSIDNTIKYPVYIKRGSKISSHMYKSGISSFVNVLYNISGVDKEEKMVEDRIELENDEFNSNFIVECENEVQAREIITFEKMERLLELKNNANREFDIAYMDKDIYVWIDNIELFYKAKRKIKYDEQVYEEVKTIIGKLPEIKRILQMKGV